MLYNGDKVSYYVILTVDCVREESIVNWLPRRSVRRQMDLTEGNEQGDYDYLGEDWENHKHRKLVGLLSQSQFDRLVEDCDLYADDIETMGSLTELGWLPAISFNGESGYYDDIVFTSAYVTPVVEDKTLTDDDWSKIRQLVLENYS